MFNQIVIVGVGLIGGSLARALRVAGGQGNQNQGNRVKLIGIERTAANVARITTLRIVDQAILLEEGDGDDKALSANALEAFANAALIVLAAPVAQTEALMAQIAPHLKPHTVITDTGSTKVQVIHSARHTLRDKIGQFVPAHPIAGRELSGAQAALNDLYVGCPVIVCPLPENPPDAIARVTELWRAVGAQVHTLTAEQHDRVFAAVSHLPHLLAFALMEQLLSSDESALKLAFAGSSFRDFTRIAASNPKMWRDICLTNRTKLLADLDAYGVVLNKLRAAIDSNDGAMLELVFTRAAAARRQWNNSPATKAKAQ